MYTGHVALALAARGLRGDLPLFVLVVVSQACDWVELGARAFVPQPAAEVYSHAFPFIVIAAGIAALLVWLWKRSLGAALTVMALYLSHAPADFITGFKPLWWGGPYVGLGLTGRPGADFMVQATLCACAIAVYSRSLTAHRTRLRQVAIASPLVLLLLLQALSDVVLHLGGKRLERSGRDAPQRVSRAGAKAAHNDAMASIALTMGRSLNRTSAR
jgi:hypothetical protein